MSTVSLMDGKTGKSMHVTSLAMFYYSRGGPIPDAGRQRLAGLQSMASGLGMRSDAALGYSCTVLPDADASFSGLWCCSCCVTAGDMTIGEPIPASALTLALAAGVQSLDVLGIRGFWGVCTASGSDRQCELSRIACCCTSSEVDAVVLQKAS